MSELERRIFAAMEDYFADDSRRIDHARLVTEYAGEILASEPGDREVVIPAAILHDIGIKECERKYRSTGGQLQEKEGPPIARDILNGLGVDANIVSEVCTIIASHHSPGEVDTANFRVLWDADWLVNLGDEYDAADKGKLRAIIDKVFLTNSGRLKAIKIYLE